MAKQLRLSFECHYFRLLKWLTIVVDISVNYETPKKVFWYSLSDWWLWSLLKSDKTIIRKVLEFTSTALFDQTSCPLNVLIKEESMHNGMIINKPSKTDFSSMHGSASINLKRYHTVYSSKFLTLQVKRKHIWCVLWAI